LSDQLSWLKVQNLFGIEYLREELTHSLGPTACARERHSFYFEQRPLDVLGKQSEYALDVSVFEVLVRLLHQLRIFSFAHG
jgi:hypothetical protein